MFSGVFTFSTCRVSFCMYLTNNAKFLSNFSDLRRVINGSSCCSGTCKKRFKQFGPNSQTFCRMESQILFWSVNYSSDDIMTWNFTNKFHLNKILLRPTFIEITLSVNDLLHFICFSLFQTEDKLIIYRPAKNCWLMNLIFMKHSQIIYYINLYKFAKFQIIPTLKTDFTD